MLQIFKIMHLIYENLHIIYEILLIVGERVFYSFVIRAG